jgi:hypothetical protein
MNPNKIFDRAETVAQVMNRINNNLEALGIDKLPFEVLITFTLSQLKTLLIMTEEKKNGF